MSKSTFWYRTLALVLSWFSLAGIQACSSSAGDNESTPVLSSSPNTTYPIPPLDENKAISQMGWVSLDGQRQTLSSYQDRVLVLDFYATWCRPCREAIPHLMDLQRRHGSEGLSIVGLNVGGPDDWKNVPAFARELNIQYPLGVPDQALASILLWDNDGIPQTFVFDRRGQLAKRFIGYGSSTATELETAITTALGQSPRQTAAQ